MSTRLPETVTVFDGPTDDFSCMGDIINHNPVQPTTVQQLRAGQARSLLIESLVEQLCTFKERDPIKQKQLFHYICQHLTQLKFLTPGFQREETVPVRSRFHEIIRNFIELSVLHFNTGAQQTQNSLVRRGSTFNSLLSPELIDFCKFMNGEIIFHNSRYELDFEEIEAIAAGGFGIVCKAWKKVDQQYYAVKKIPFKFIEDPLLKKVLREVEFLAQNSHPNVVSYKTAWLEAPSEYDPVFDSIETSSGTNTKDELRSGESGLSWQEKSKQQVDDDEFVIFQSENHKYSESNHVYTESYTSNTISCQNTCQIAELPEVNFNRELSNQILSKSIMYQRSFSTELVIGDSFRKHKEKPNKIIEVSENSGKASSDPALNVVARPVCRRSSSTELPCVIGARSKANCESNQKMGVLYVQMELCQESLKQWLDNRMQKDSEIDIPQALSILKQVLKGVEYLHSKGIIHRDLKPQNILFRESAVKIGDFGLATLCCHQGEGDVNVSKQTLYPWVLHTQGVGTSPYAAPEQRAGMHYGPKADMYSIGVILLELLYSFHTSMELSKCFEGKCNLPITLRESHPEAAKVIILLTQHNPDKRPSATDILNSELFLSKSQVIENLKKQLAENDRATAEKDKIIIEKDRVILEKDRVIEDKNKEIIILKTRLKYMKTL